MLFTGTFVFMHMVSFYGLDKCDLGVDVEFLFPWPQFSI